MHTNYKGRVTLKFYTNSNGYTLLIAVCALLIFSVIGLSLVSVTANGLKKNESREFNVLATDLADKGISYAVSDFQFQLENLIKNPIGKTTFGTELDKLLGYNSTTEQLTSTSNKYHCGPTTLHGLKIDSSKGENYTNVCIQNVEMNKTNGLVEEKDRYKRLVTLKSTGVVDGKIKETFSKVIIGTDAIPDQLKYAVSTNEGGNLFLHGGIEIKGDIKTAGNLILTNKASWGTASDPNSDNRWTDSLYPKIIKNDTSVTPKIIMQEEGKNIYNLKFNNTTLKSSFYKNNHIKGTSLSNTSYYDKLSFNENVLSNYLFNSNDVMLVKRKLNDDQVDIDNEFNNISSNAIRHDSLTNGLTNTDKNKVYHIAQYKKPNCNKNCNTSGSITIDNKSSARLVGKYYVDGDVEITDSNLYADAILYVKGNVKIDGSTVLGTNTNSTLFIFAKGDITFSNIYQKTSGDKQYDLKGFYYSQSNMHILGVKSHMKITGGVSGKDIILTGVRGIGKNNDFDSVNAQRTKEARLKIIYDENLIKQFHEFKRDEEEEFIKSINDPEILERY